MTTTPEAEIRACLVTALKAVLGYLEHRGVRPFAEICRERKDAIEQVLAAIAKAEAQERTET